jgi:hypothetical protein
MFGFMAVASAFVIAIYTRINDIRPSTQRAGRVSH